MTRREVFLAAAVLLLAAFPSILPAARAPLGARLLSAIDRLDPDTALLAEAEAARDPGVRVLAARLLAAVADPALVGVIERFSRDRAPVVRREAQLAAGRSGPVARRIVERGLADRDATVRAAAVRAAGFLGGAAPERVLRLLRRERDPRVLAAMGEALPSFPVAWREPVVRRLEGAGGPRVRLALAAGLARSGTGHGWLRRLAGDPDPRVRAHAVAGLGRGNGEPADRAVVLGALGDPDPAVRAAAAAVLVRRRHWRLGPSGAKALLRAARDPALHVRVLAIRALGRHGETGGNGVLERAVDGPRRWPAAEALEALVRRGRSGGRGDMWLGSAERWRRETAARCVALAGGPMAAADRRALSDPEPAVRLAWVSGLEPGRQERVGPALRRLLDADPDPMVRAAVVEMLAGAGVLDRAALLKLAGRWAGEEPADARAAALVGALEASGDRTARREVLTLARRDPSPLVAALVVDAARRHGMAAAYPVRPGETTDWYLRTLAWARRPCWIDLVTVRGTVRLRLEARDAPLTARRIHDLAAAGFYDGLTFHRVVPDFVVQGGDPRGDGWGSGGLLLPDEPGLAPFEQGAVGIATSGPNTGGCQLFAMLLGAPHLDGRYTRFARVVAGQDVLERIGRWDGILRAVVHEGEEPPAPVSVLVGPLEPGAVLAVRGWREVYDAYRPEPGEIARLRGALEAGAFLRIEVVLGTWCSDSRREVPRLLKVLEALGPDAPVTVRLEGVDRTKTVEDPAWDPAVLPGEVAGRVPEIVVLGPDGEELARVVETAVDPLETVLARAAERTLGEVER